MSPNRNGTDHDIPEILREPSRPVYSYDVAEEIELETRSSSPLVPMWGFRETRTSLCPSQASFLMAT